MTGVNVLHEKRLLGAGVRIAVIDSGVDYKNPILGGCFGAGCKIAYGYAFVSDYSSDVQSPDPYTNCSEHGTHVSVGSFAPTLSCTNVFRLPPAAPRAWA